MGKGAALFQILLIVLGLALSPTTASAAGAIEALRAHVERARAVFEDPRLKADSRATERRAALRKVVGDIFDFNEMARRALRPHWEERTAAERAEFVRLFVGLLEHSYLAYVELYAGEPTTYVGASGDRNATTVRTRIVPKRGVETPVEYRMHHRGERWRVSDVVVDGVSLVANYRAQFNEIIRSSSYAELVGRMRALEDGQAAASARSR